MPYIVIVTYEFPTDDEDSAFGTFRTGKAAERFADAVRAWDGTRTDTSEVRQVTTRVLPVTKPMLEFVQEDVERHSEVPVIPRYVGPSTPAGGEPRG